MKLVKPFLALLLFLSACTFEENVQFEKIKNVQLTSVQDGMVNLSAEAYFFNPNDLAGKLKSIDLQVLLNNNVLAEISHHDNIKIEKQASFSAPFTASFAMEDIQQGFLDNLLTIISGKKLKLHFKGEIKVSTWGFTQTVPVDYYEEVKL